MLMLDRLFLQILDMSKTASVVILAVLLARLLLKKAPKIVSYGLWAVVLFRLLCPVAVKAPVSIIPEMTPAAQNYRLSGEPISLAGAGIAAYRAVGDALNGGLGIQYIPTTETEDDGSVRYATSSWGEVWILAGQYIWVAGMAVMLLRSVAGYGRLRRKIRIAVPLGDDGTVYIADEIQSPFVLGIFRPKIYLPCGLGEREQEYIILHEEHHIRRGDHIWKIAAFLALCVHWFNPLVWAAFVLAGKDMEMSCDEAVVCEMGEGVRAEYSASLLALATGRRSFAGTPLAFGEGDTKARIRNLGRWKQPVLGGLVAAVAACLLLTVCLATDPADGNGKTQEISGVVTEWQTGDGGELTAIIIRDDAGGETGILITEETTAFGGRGGTEKDMLEAFQAALQPDMVISAGCTRGKKTLATGNGDRITGREARYIRVTGRLQRGAAALRDGTMLDVEEDDLWGRRVYRLEDGTELLLVRLPNGPANVYAGNTACFDDLNERAQRKVSAFYEQRGVLYDEQEELERVYALYRELGEDFCAGMVEQSVLPSASNDRVIYFLTTVALPAGRENGNIGYEMRLCDAFERETGEHIDTWDLFTETEETVMGVLLDECGITDPGQRAEMMAASWDGRIEFSAEGLMVVFGAEADFLSGDRVMTGFSVDYTPAVRAVMQEWAVPEG